MTGTRPALDVAWSSPVLPAGVLERSIEKMQEAGRVPRYAVRLKIGPRASVPSVVHHFVRLRYSKPVVLGDGRFEVRELGLQRTLEKPH